MVCRCLHSLAAQLASSHLYANLQEMERGRSASLTDGVSAAISRESKFCYLRADFQKNVGTRAEIIPHIALEFQVGACFQGRKVGWVYKF